MELFLQTKKFTKVKSSNSNSPNDGSVNMAQSEKVGGTVLTKTYDPVMK